MEQLTFFLHSKIQLHSLDAFLFWTYIFLSTNSVADLDKICSDKTFAVDN